MATVEGWGEEALENPGPHSKLFMMKRIKMNTALFICAAFAFRILFFNIFVISSLNFQQTDRVVKTHFSTAMKRRVNFETTDNSENVLHSFAEICEEKDTNENGQFESNPFFLIQALYSFSTSETASKLKRLISFYNYLSYSSSHRYLMLQVLRT